MASACMSQTNFQQQQYHLPNNNMMVQQQIHHQQFSHQQQQQQQQNAMSVGAPKILGTSNLQNIQPSSEGFGPMMQAKKKYTYLNMPYGEQLPSVARRNARERNRVKQVNNGFSNLRQHLPQTVVNSLSNGGRGASKKLSKVDTLRIAVEYIRGLQDMLDGTGENSTSRPTLLLDDSSNDGSNYGYSSVGSPVDPTQFTMAHSYNSEASASPTPSYSDSDISIGGANYLPAVSNQTTTTTTMQFKFEPFDSYTQLANDEDQPDDEELLDYISSWQEQ